MTCPVYEPPLTQTELREVRALLPGLPKLRHGGVRDVLGPYLAPEAFGRPGGPTVKDVFAADQRRTDAHRSAAEAIREFTSRKVEGAHQLRELKARVHLEERIRKAVAAALDGAPQVQKGAVDVVAEWAASAAVYEFVDFLQNPPVFKVEADGSETISYRFDVPDPDAAECPGLETLIHDDPRGPQR